MRSRIILICAASAAVLTVVWLLWRQMHTTTQTAAVVENASTNTAKNPKPSNADLSPTRIHAHNLLLRKGPEFRVYVRWLEGRMARARRSVNPSFDDPESFYLDIQTGVLRANIGDIGNYLNKGLTGSPLRNIKLSGDGQTVKLNGTLKKVIPLPIELTGELSATNDDRIRIHVTKLNVLKIPFKFVLGVIHVSVSDLFKSKDIEGLEVQENDLYFDTQKLLPPPHIRGHLTRVRVVNPDLEEVFGDAQEKVESVEEWRNFLRLKGGTIDFGKLTMHGVDLIMIDISKDLWFNLDLTHYQDQLINGFTRVTPDSGLQIFMPDLRTIPPSQLKHNTSIEWFKNRNIPPPPDVIKGHK